MIYRFADFELDEERRELRLHGREVVLQPRVFDLLRYLVQRRSTVVSKEEILEALWPGVIVVDGALHRAVSLARSALREGGVNDAIRTHARKGYRFSADVSEEHAVAERETEEPLLLARTAFDAANWSEAAAGFQAADARSALTAADLERWAQAIQFQGKLQDCLAPLERAVAAHGAVGDRLGQARVANKIALVKFEQRELAVAKGWQARAGRMLETLEESPVHGEHQWLSSRIAAAEGRLDDAFAHAEKAYELGRRMGDADVEVLGLIYKGLVMIARGEVSAGVTLQDEAAASVLAGGVSPRAGSLTYCSVIWGCRNRADWERAAQWTDQFTQWCNRNGMQAYPGVCRLHRAEVLSVRGQLSEAEREVLAVCEQAPVVSPWAEGDAYRVLGDIRLMRGETDSAEALYRRAYELGWDPQPGLARLQLERGEGEAALKGLERSLNDTGWFTAQRRDLLLVEFAAVAALVGDVTQAEAALRELESNGEFPSTAALHAMHCRARAEVAYKHGEYALAVSHYREGVRLWHLVGSPLSAAHYRLRLAQLLQARDDDAGAELELSAAERVFSEVEAPRMLDTCSRIRDTLKR